MNKSESYTKVYKSNLDYLMYTVILQQVKNHI